MAGPLDHAMCVNMGRDTLRMVFMQLVGDAPIPACWVLLLRSVCREWRSIMAVVGSKENPVVFRLRLRCLQLSPVECRMGLCFLARMHAVLTVPSRNKEMIRKFSIAARGVKFGIASSAVRVESDEWLSVVRKVCHGQNDVEASAYSVVSKEISEMCLARVMPSEWACVEELKRWKSFGSDMDANLISLLERRFSCRGVSRDYRQPILDILIGMQPPAVILEFEWVQPFIMDCLLDKQQSVKICACRLIQKMVMWTGVSLPDEIFVRISNLIWEVSAVDQLDVVISFGMICRQRGSMPATRHAELMDCLVSGSASFKSFVSVFGFLVVELLRVQPTLVDACNRSVVDFLCRNVFESKECKLALRMIVCSSSMGSLVCDCHAVVEKLMKVIVRSGKYIQRMSEAVRIVLAYSSLSPCAFQVVSSEKFFRVLADYSLSFYDGICDKALARFAALSDTESISEMAVQCLSRNVGNTDVVASVLIAGVGGFKSVQMLSRILGLEHVVRCEDGCWNGLLDHIEQRGALVLMGYMVFALGCMPYPIFERLVWRGKSECLVSIGEVSLPTIRQCIGDSEDCRFLYLLIFGSAAAVNLAGDIDFRVLDAMELYAYKGFCRELLPVRQQLEAASSKLEAAGISAAWLLAQIDASEEQL